VYKPTINRQLLLDTIDYLKASDRFTVAELARELNYSRTYLYKHFGDLLPQSGKLATEEKILSAISMLRAKTGRKKLTISEVANQSGLSRQSLNKYYNHLYPYIEGHKDLEIIEPKEAELHSRIRELEYKHNHSDEKKLKEFEQFKKSTYSTLMKMDLNTFEGVKTKASIDNLQTQNSELAKQNQAYLAELSELRASIISLNHQSKTSSDVELISHLMPDYSVIEKISESGADDKAVMKIFLSEERKHLDNAIEICLETKPDLIVLFQPFLSCNIDSMSFTPKKGKVIIVESNIITDRSRRDFVDAVQQETAAVYAVSHVSNTKFFCRTNKLPFSLEFIDNFHNKIMVPILDEGFSTVLSFKPKNVST